MTTPTLSYLTDIYFDFGSLKVLPELLKKYRISRPLIVTDKGLVELGILEKLGIASVVFDHVETNPTEGMVLEGTELYRKSECDGIVSVGGGSPIDLAKCVAILVKHAPPLE